MPLTKKAVLYLSLAYFFVGLALIFRLPALAIFVIPIALIFFYSALSSQLRSPNISVRRRLNPSRSFGGENISVTVEVLNNLGVDVGELRLSDNVPEPLGLENGTNSFVISLKPFEHAEHSYQISAPKRGRYALGPLRATSVDPMGFRQYSTAISGNDAVMILPHVDDLGTVDLKAKRVGPWPGMIPSKSVGAGTEFFELRLYMQGDELRRINWKASARQGRLVTNEFETERVTDVLVVLDCSEGILSGLYSFDAEEFEVRLAASLCSQLLLQGNRVGLLLYGAERTWVPPGFGKRQLLRILSSLTVAKAGRAVIPIDFAVQTIVTAVIPARSVVSFITPLMGDETVEVVRNVASAGYSVLCLTPRPDLPAKDESPSKLLAMRMLEAERRLNMRQIASVSRVHEVSPHSSLRAPLRRGTLRKPT